MNIELDTLLILIILILLLIVIVLILMMRGRIEKEVDHRLDQMEHNLSLSSSSSINNTTSLLISTINQNNQSQNNALNNISETMKDNALLQETQMNNLRISMDKNIMVMTQENNRRLQEIQKSVDEKLQDTLSKRLNESFQSVSLQLQKVHEGLGEMQQLANGVGDLKKVLSNVKTRGILGEVQLGAILKDILSGDQYEENVATIPGSKERVEYAIRLPGNDGNSIYLPIDSKFPLDCYQKLNDAIDSGDANRIAECRKELVARLKSEAKDIHDKYVQIPYTTEFGILFLPTEGLYSTCCELNMMEELQKQYRIMISGPSSMAALLNSLQMGFQSLSIQQRSAEVWALLGSVKTEFGRFEEVLTAVQSRIQQTSDELDKLVGVRTRAINRQLRNISAGGITAEQIELNKTEEGE